MSTQFLTEVEVAQRTSPQKMFLDVRTIRRAMSSESSSAERK
jgi:hypothetical protein